MIDPMRAMISEERTSEIGAEHRFWAVCDLFRESLGGNLSQDPFFRLELTKLIFGIDRAAEFDHIVVEEGVAGLN